MVSPRKQQDCHDYRHKRNQQSGRVFYINFITYTVKTGNSAFMILTLRTITATVNNPSKTVLRNSHLNQGGMCFFNMESSFSPDPRLSYKGEKKDLNSDSISSRQQPTHIAQCNQQLTFLAMKTSQVKQTATAVIPCSLLNTEQKHMTRLRQTHLKPVAVSVGLSPNPHYFATLHRHITNVNNEEQDYITILGHE